MLKLFEQCPACGGPLVVTECRCANCQLKMQGEFRPPLFATLSDDQLTFIRAFLRVRGNLSEMEKVLGVSYPTIRNKLDEINKSLERIESSLRGDESRNAPESEPNPTEDARRAILQKVAAGEISAADAVEEIKNLGGKNG